MNSKDVKDVYSSDIVSMLKEKMMSNIGSGCFKFDKAFDDNGNSIKSPESATNTLQRWSELSEKKFLDHIMTEEMLNRLFRCGFIQPNDVVQFKELFEIYGYRVNETYNHKDYKFILTSAVNKDCYELNLLSRSKIWILSGEFDITFAKEVRIYNDVDLTIRIADLVEAYNESYVLGEDCENIIANDSSDVTGTNCNVHAKTSGIIKMYKQSVCNVGFNGVTVEAYDESIVYEFSHLYANIKLFGDSYGHIYSKYEDNVIEVHDHAICHVFGKTRTIKQFGSNCIIWNRMRDPDKKKLKIIYVESKQQTV